MIKQTIGILPCAGIASRLNINQYPKELMPILYSFNTEKKECYPKTIVEQHIMSLSQSGIKKHHIIISPTKISLLNHLESLRESNKDLHFTYIFQMNPMGLASALWHIVPWVDEKNNYLLFFPDAVFTPLNSVDVLIEYAMKEKTDLLLGVFPTDNPEDLGPVDFHKDGTIRKIYEKPESSLIKNTWGLVILSANFFKMLETMISYNSKILSIDHYFHEAIKRDLHCKAVYFDNGEYIDIGTFKGLYDYLYSSMRK